MTARENTITEEDEDQAYEYQKPAQNVTQSLDDDMMLILARRRPTENKQKYVFLSEKDTEVKGEFSERYKDDRENKDLPKAYDASEPKAFSAMGGMISASASPDKSRGKLSTCVYIETKLKTKQLRYRGSVMSCLLRSTVLNRFQ